VSVARTFSIPLSDKRLIAGLSARFGTRLVPLAIPIGTAAAFDGVVDLVSHPEDRTLKASTWTRGVYQRRLDAAPPDDVRLMIRATRSRSCSIEPGSGSADRRTW